MLLAALAALVRVPPAGAQVVGIDPDETPRVASISFNDVSALGTGDLRDAIVTEARRCKSFLLAPFCWVTNSPLFEARPRLDVEELERDVLRIRVLYWRSGYRETTASARVTPAGDGVDVTFDIVEGEPTLVSAVDVQQTVPVLGEQAIARAELPRPGEPLDMDVLDSARVSLRTALWQVGYGDAVVRDSVLLAGEYRAAVRVVIEPNARTTVQDVAVDGNEDVTTRTVQRIVGLRPGQIFRLDDLTYAQRRLYRSELFRQALLQVPEPQDSAKQVLVTVREAPFNAFRGGVGINTIEFGQAQARFTRYNWLGGGRRFDLHATVGNLLAPQLYGKSVFGSAVPQGISDDVDASYLRLTWRLSAEVMQPWLFSTRNALSVGVFAQRRSVPGIVVDQSHGVSTTLTRELAPATSVSLTYRYERTRVAAGDVYFCVNFGICGATIIDALRETRSLSPFQLNVLIERADDPLEPTHGWTASLEAEHASAASASDFRHNRVTASATRYLRLGPGVLAGVVRAGWVRGSGGTATAIGIGESERVLVHPRKRLYAGGSRSVRGYAENQLGPRILTIDPQRLLAPSDSSRGEPCTTASIADGSCDPNVAVSDEFVPRPLGGSSVFAASIEYRLPLSETVVGALFVDGASVGDADLNVPAGPRRAITPGLGIRYRSPIGPIRVDLGVRPDITEELPVVTQLPGEDGELHLVQLTTLKQYDPVEASGGFLRSIFSRLQLHLSIGEAF
jgi:outer membrane protein assembly factor BamA